MRMVKEDFPECRKIKKDCCLYKLPHGTNLIITVYIEIHQIKVTKVNGNTVK